MTSTPHHEIADGIHRFATWAPDAGITFCQFLIDAEQPLLFHTGHRRMFPTVHEAIARVVDPTNLRWIAFGHVEADECGSMSEWLAAAPQAEVVHGQLGTMVSVDEIVVAGGGSGESLRRNGSHARYGTDHRSPGGSRTACAGAHARPELRRLVNRRSWRAAARTCR